MTFQDGILLFNPDDGSWTQVGQMKIARSYHGASVVNVHDIVDYCQANTNNSTIIKKE